VWHSSIVPEQPPQADRSPGLCASCVNLQVVTSARGSQFVLCRLSATDQRFPKYPRLPVVTCTGYQKREQIPQ
jgi:hypothetical protein